MPLLQNKKIDSNPIQLLTALEEDNDSNEFRKGGASFSKTPHAACQGQKRVSEHHFAAKKES
jgi:hypothetical protein